MARGYPATIDTVAKKSLYDNLGGDEVLVTKVDTAVRYTKKDDWTNNLFKTKEVKLALAREVEGHDVDIDELLELVKNQREYK